MGCRDDPSCCGRNLMRRPSLAASLIELCGLSRLEASTLLRVGIDTVRSWSCGRASPPRAAIVSLASLAMSQARAAEEALAMVEAREREQDGPPAAVELVLARDDAEARRLGWPCVGAQRAALARTAAALIARGLIVRLVYRRGTPT